MRSSANRPTAGELGETFARELNSALSGGGVRSDTGLDDEVDTALAAIQRAYPKVPAELIEAAKSAFRGQIDGSSNAAQEERAAQMFREQNRRTG